MEIRIKPREIDVPEDDPFKYDLLGRKEPVEILTHLISSLNGPDGPVGGRGMGKWKNHVFEHLGTAPSQPEIPDRQLQCLGDRLFRRSVPCALRENYEWAYE